MSPSPEAFFQESILAYCAAQEWQVSEVDGNHAVVNVTLPSGRQQTLYAIRYGETLEFSAPSAAGFDREEQIPHFLSTLLLEINARNRLGFWCIERIEEKLVYSCMYNLEARLLDQNIFGQIARALTGQCARFEDTLQAILAQGE